MSRIRHEKSTHPARSVSLVAGSRGAEAEVAFLQGAGARHDAFGNFEGARSIALQHRVGLQARMKSTLSLLSAWRLELYCLTPVHSNDLSGVCLVFYHLAYA